MYSLAWQQSRLCRSSQLGVSCATARAILKTGKRLSVHPAHFNRCRDDGEAGHPDGRVTVGTGRARQGFCARGEKTRIQDHGAQRAGGSSRGNARSDGLVCSRILGKPQEMPKARPLAVERRLSECPHSLVWPGPICGIQFLSPPKIIIRSFRLRLSVIFVTHAWSIRGWISPSRVPS